MVMSVPIAFSSIRFPVASALLIAMPSWPLPEIRLAAAQRRAADGVVRGILDEDAAEEVAQRMHSGGVGADIVALDRVAGRPLAGDRDAVGEVARDDVARGEVVPPMVLPVAALPRETPPCALPRAWVPVTSVPIRFPRRCSPWRNSPG